MVRSSQPAVPTTINSVGAVFISTGHHDVLDPNTEGAGEVDPRLDREGHPRLQQGRVAGHQIRMFVHLEADTVTGPGDEVFPVAGPLDHAAGGGVDRLGGHTGPHRGDPGRLGPADELVDLVHPAGDLVAGCRRHHVGPCAVGEITAGHGAADVDHHDVAGLDDPVRCLVVRARTVGSG